jgi:hypothetical protein
MRTGGYPSQAQSVLACIAAATWSNAMPVMSAIPLAFLRMTMGAAR